MHKVFTTWCVPFANRILDFQGPGYALGLCTLFITYVNRREPCFSLNLEVGNTFVILRNFEAK